MLTQTFANTQNIFQAKLVYYGYFNPKINILAITVNKYNFLIFSTKYILIEILFNLLFAVSYKFLYPKQYLHE